MRTRAIATAVVLSWLAHHSPAAAQPPNVVSAQVVSHAAGSDFARTMQNLVSAQGSPAWIGYAVPMIPGEHSMCCWGGEDRCCGRCRLEGASEAAGVSRQASDTKRVALEGDRMLVVLFRAEQGKIQKLRMFSPECELDAGSLPFHWLTGVRAADSIAFLGSLAIVEDQERQAHKIADSAVAAIAFHNDAAADDTLERFVAANQPERLRERTAFWLGNARGRRGYETLARLVREDPSDKVRDKAVFALTQSDEPEAVDKIIETAKSDRSAHVRGQALFWLAQKAGRRASATISEAIENDPETEVKKKAVFALSQLPKDEGVPKLIEVARGNRNPAVRKQAMFWLGQSNDPRALAFFEEVLAK